MDQEQKGFWDWLFGEGKPKGSKVPDKSEMAGGHRGIAAGDLRPGKQDLSGPNVSKWEQLTGDEVERFVVGGEKMYVHSTNVRSFRYVLKQQVMYVEFKDGSEYVYYTVTPQEAIRAAQYQSKGGWVWDTLIGRGWKKGKGPPRKAYRKIS